MMERVRPRGRRIRGRGRRIRGGGRGRWDHAARVRGRSKERLLIRITRGSHGRKHNELFKSEM